MACPAIAAGRLSELRDGHRYCPAGLLMALHEELCSVCGGCSSCCECDDDDTPLEEVDRALEEEIAHCDDYRHDPR